MSLYKQLWIAIVSIMLLSFIGSFVLSNQSAKIYLEEQLHLKNIDNVNSLALSLSSAEQSDLVLIELFIAAQYDTGHYQYIRLNDPEGDVLFELSDDATITTVPSWLKSLFPINATPGTAQISHGWQQIGTLTLNSHTRFAYAELWRSSKRLTLYFTAAGILFGLIGCWVLQIIIKPLHSTVRHAKAIGDRRFITTPEPKTLEFKALVKAMNRLSLRVKKMLDKESSKLERLRQDTQTDKATGLMKREPFMDQLTTLLARDDASSNGILIMVRIVHLQEIGQQQGSRVLDTLLKQFGATLNEQSQCFLGSFCARINDTDFVLVAPGKDNPRDIAQPLHDFLQQVFIDLDLHECSRLPCVAEFYHFGDSLPDLMANIDHELKSVQSSESETILVVSDSTSVNIHPQLNNWEKTLTKAINEEAFELKSFPVVDRNSALLHTETPVRLQLDDGNLLSAGQFIPWLKKLGLTPQLDFIVIKLALKQIQESSVPVCINISTELLSDSKNLTKITDLMKQQRHCTDKLWLEIPEPGVYLHLNNFRTLCNLLKPLGCKIGVEHVGPNVAHTGSLYDLGLDYIKIDGSFSHNIVGHDGNQIFLRGLCSIAHSIGLLAIAEQVTTQAQWEQLKALGVDGGTGRYFK